LGGIVIGQCLSVDGDIAQGPGMSKTSSAQAAERAVSLPDAIRWGWLPALSVVDALGLLLVALAVTGARHAATWSEPLYWTGLLIMFMPTTVRLASANTSRRERIGLVVLLGLSLYLVKVLHSPVGFTLVDEFQHWRTVIDILQSGHLFHENPLLPVSPLYPGLENVTSALASLSGLTTFDVGIVVLGIARLVLVLALYLFFEQVSRSPRVAGMALVLYMANPSFLYFDAQYAYESLALPLAMWTLWAIALQEGISDRHRVWLKMIALLGVGAVVVTHHITSYALVAFLVLWTVTFYWRRRGEASHPNPAGTALVALVAALAWLILVANTTVGYLAPVLEGAVRELVQLIAGEALGREFFRSGAGHVAPLWERLAGFASVGMILLGLPFGLVQAWRQHREKAIALALMGGAFVYPAGLALRLTQAGAETSQRTSAFVFVAIVFVLAIGVAELWLSRYSDWKRRLAFTAWATVIFVGGIVVGMPAWVRLPGPYLVGSDSRSIERQGIAAAEWTRALLGPGHRMTSDRTNRFLLGTYGEQIPLRTGASQIFFATELGAAQRAFLRSGRLQYVVFDRRLSQQLSELGIYVEKTEPGAYHHTTPLDPRTFAMFDNVPNTSRLFDSGDITIYDVGALSNEP
jgi:hypothetical protein